MKGNKGNERHTHTADVYSRCRENRCSISQRQDKHDSMAQDSTREVNSIVTCELIN